MSNGADSRLVTITTVLLDIFVIGPRGEVGRPWLTLAWRAGAEAPCGVHVGLGDATDNYLRTCVADEVGIARRALELDGEAIDDVLLRGKPVTFALDHSRESYAFAEWASGRGLDVMFRARGPVLWSRIERELLHIVRALAPPFPIAPDAAAKEPLDDLRERVAHILASRARSRARARARD